MSTQPDLVAALDGSDRRQMEAAVHAGHRTSHGFAGDIADHQLDPMGQVGAPSRGQIVQHPDLVATRKQRVGQMGPDKAGTTGHQPETHENPQNTLNTVETGCVLPPLPPVAGSKGGHPGEG